MMLRGNWLAQWQVTTLLTVQHMLVLWESWVTQCQITTFGHCTKHDVILEGHCIAHDVIVRKLAHSVPNYNFRSLYNALCNTRRSLHNTWCHSKKTGSPEGKLLFLSRYSTWCHKVRILAVLTSGYYFKSLYNTRCHTLYNTWCHIHIWESLITWCMLTWWAKHSLRSLV